jgi:hypothetical protein
MDGSIYVLNSLSSRLEWPMLEKLLSQLRSSSAYTSLHTSGKGGK